MRLLLVLLAIVATLVAAAFLVRFEYAPVPATSDLLNPERRTLDVAYDVLGREITRSEADELQQTDDGRRRLSPAEGAIRVDEDLRQLGRRAFYNETFGNEWFMTDVMGLTRGALTPFQVAKAVLKLRGRGTTDLQVELAETVTFGGRTYEKGTLVSTGIDVPRGSFAPLGMKVVYDRGTIRVGATCALCHATVDPESGRVVEGAPNADLAVGPLLAMATNSAAYLGHVDINGIDRQGTDPARTVTGRNGEALPLPDPAATERAVDDMLAAWAPGNFDSTPDGINNPTQIPDSFTRHDHPFGWSGFAAVGPFRGLNTLTNNVHGLNADMTTIAEAADALLGMDPELYLGILLQNAANPDLRFDPDGGRRPSEVLKAATPWPAGPALIRSVALPSFPKGSYVATNSVLASEPDHPVWHHVSAMSAFQETLLPPPSPPAGDAVALGRQVFEEAGCGQCHAGPGYTNNRVLPVAEVGTQPSRAQALMKQGQNLAPPVLYTPDTSVPLPQAPKTLPVPVGEDEAAQLQLAFAADGRGGYKVKGLVGLRWTAPYLHDGGVAVGPDPERDIGLPDTVHAGVRPDPANSLRALVDRELRRRVIDANRQDARPRATNVSGEGHDFYVDAAEGFTEAQQDALIAFLLSLDGRDRR